MAIKVKCDSCKKVINAPEKFAGKRTKCPGCKAPISIPALEAEPVAEETIEVEPADETVEVPSPKAKKGKGKLGGKKLGGGPKGKKLGGGGPKGKLGKSGSMKKGRTKPAAASRKKSNEDSDDMDDVPEKSNKMLFILIGAAVALIAIGAGAYFFFMGGGDDPASPASSKPVAAAKPKIDTLDVIPNSSAGMGGFNIHKLLEIPMVVDELSKKQDPAEMEKFFSELEDNETTQALKAEIEKDGMIAAIKKRFEKITFAFDAPEDMSAPKPDLKGVAILNTSSDAAALMKEVFAMMKEKSNVKDLDGDFQGYEFTDDKGEQGVISSLSNDLILVGPAESAALSMELASDPGSDKSIKNSEGLLASTAEVKDNILWIVFENPNEAPEPKEPSEAAPPMGMAPPFGAEDVKSFMFSLDYESDTLKILIAIGLFDETKVEPSKMMLQMVAPMGLGSIGIPPDQLKVTAEGGTLKASLELDAAMLEQISAKAKEMGQGMQMQMGAPEPGGMQ